MNISKIWICNENTSYYYNTETGYVTEYNANDDTSFRVAADQSEVHELTKRSPSEAVSVGIVLSTGNYVIDVFGKVWKKYE